LIQDWGQILMHLMIFIGDRVNVSLWGITRSKYAS